MNAFSLLVVMIVCYGCWRFRNLAFGLWATRSERQDIEVSKDRAEAKPSQIGPTNSRSDAIRWRLVLMKFSSVVVMAGSGGMIAAGYLDSVYPIGFAHDRATLQNIQSVFAINAAIFVVTSAIIWKFFPKKGQPSS